jgi:uncharacterized protein (TIGR02466 family)
VSDKVEIVTNNNIHQVSQYQHFPVTIYSVDAPEFLESVNKVSEKYLDKQKATIETVNELYPSIMTESFFHEESIAEFTKFVGQQCYNALESQGYNLFGLGTTFYEMWTQEHQKTSSMEQHVHTWGSQIVGFYFLETPENCSKAIFHDPKPGKVQLSLAETNPAIATAASNMINFEPRAGQLLFSNAWLPHSFSRNGSDKPMKFVHFTAGLMQDPLNTKLPNVEVI